MKVSDQVWHLMLLCLTGLMGCGTNRFEQELQTEEAAIKLANETVQGDYQLVSTQDLEKMLEAGEDFLLIDAMPAEDSFNQGHIPQAVNFPFPKEVMEGWNDDVMGDQKQADFEDLLGDDPDRTIVVYCGYVKCARSHNAAVCARELGYKDVYRYPGGIYAWQGAGKQLTTD